MLDIADLVVRAQGMQAALVDQMPRRLEQLVQDRETKAAELRHAFDEIDAAIRDAHQAFEVEANSLDGRLAEAAQAADQGFAAMITGLQRILAAAQAFDQNVLSHATAHEAGASAAGTEIVEFSNAVQALGASREALLREWAQEATTAVGRLAQAAQEGTQRLDALCGDLGQGEAAASAAMEALSRDVAAVCQRLSAAVQDGAGAVTADASSRIAGMLDSALKSGVTARLQAAQAMLAPCDAVKQAVGEDLRRAVSSLTSVLEIIRAIKPVLDAAKAIL